MRHVMRRVWQAKSSVFAVVQTVVANIAIQGANIACGILTARSLAPAGRGTLAAIIMWPNFFAYLLTLGVPLSYIYHIKKKPEMARSFSGAAIVLSLSSGLVGSLIGWVIIPFSLRTYSSADIHLAQTMVFLAPAGLCAVTLTAQLQSRGSFGHYNLFRLLSPISVLVGIVTLRATSQLSIAHAAVVYLLAGIPALCWLGYLVWTTCRPTFKALGVAIKLLLSYGLRAWGGDILGTVSSQVDRILIVSMLNPASMGLYVVAQSAAGLLAVLPSAINPVILPRIAGRSTQEIVAVTGAAVRVTVVAMSLAALPLMFAGTFMLSIVYGKKFDAAGTILPFLIVESILDGLTSVLTQAFLAAGLPGMVTLLQGCGVLAAIPLIYLLIPRYGVKGAACALMLATVVRFCFVLVNYPLRLRMRPPSFLINRREILMFVRTKQIAPIVQDT